jgi:UDP-3-O-[3-hydroxymyristoyl] glucosamine N-acyltransferase
MVRKTLTVAQLARQVGGTVEGDGQAVIGGVASLEAAGPEDLTFVADARRNKALATCRAAAAIVGADAPHAAIPLIRVEDVPAALAAVLEALAEPEDLPAAGIHPSAVVASDARLEANVAIGAGAVVGRGAQLAEGVVLCSNAVVGADVAIGANTILYGGTVVLGGCRVGRRCRIGPNAVIGSSGFGYYFAQGRHRAIRHIGTVEIGDDVDIGACSCVDRAKFGATCIGDGTKIDNLVQVAHNVQVGRDCLLAALVGIAGSTVLKDQVVLGGHVGVRDNVTVGAGVRTGACSAIAQDVPDGAVVSGIPAIAAGKWLRGVQLFARLGELHQRIKQLEKKLQTLESAKDH